MVNKLIFFFLIQLGSLSIMNGQTFSWNSYFTKREQFKITESDKHIYTANNTTVYKFENNYLTEELTKTNGVLSDNNISYIEYIDQENILLVGYQNGNIDFIRNRLVTNLPDLKISNIIGSKKINSSLYFDDRLLIGTDFGIVEININKNEIKETYYIGDNSSSLYINNLSLLNDTIIACTNNGVKKINKDKNLKIFSNWKDEPLPSGRYISFIEFNNKNYVIKDNEDFGTDEVFEKNTTWIKIDSLSNREIISLKNINERFYYLSYEKVAIYDANFNVLENQNLIYGKPIYPTDIINRDNVNYLLDYNFGFCNYEDPAFPNVLNTETIYTNEVISVEYEDNQLLTAHSFVYGFNYNKSGISVLKNNKWNWLNSYSYNYSNLENLNGAQSIVTRGENDIIVGSSLTGIYKFNNIINISNYLNTNSTLELTYWGDGPSVSAMQKDELNNVYCVSNQASEYPISYLDNNNVWHQLKIRTGLTQTSSIKMIRTSFGEFWAAMNLGDGLLVFSENGTPNDYTDDKIRILTTSTNNGNLPSNTTLCVSEDLNGTIYVGTNDGIAIFTNPQQALNNESINSAEIIIEQDGFAELVLSGEQITDIEIDGANRKWIATKTNGILLFNESLNELLQQYNIDNSPIISNEINDLEINQETGEMYIATSFGLQSFTIDATGSKSNFDDAYAYPNPIEPQYNGVITISNLNEDSFIRITNTSGKEVYKTESNGGTAIWDGKTLQGQRVSSGIYFAIISNSSGTEHKVIKLLFIQ